LWPFDVDCVKLVVPMDMILSDPKGVAEKGERLYVEKFKKEYETATYAGLFLAIDVVHEKAYEGRTPEEAYENARKGSAGEGIFHLNARRISGRISGWLLDEWRHFKVFSTLVTHLT
jgi:hypothetical protein